MKLTVTGRKIVITEAIENHLQEKMGKTIKDLGESADVHVALSVEKHRHFAEITVKTKAFTLHSEDETDDLYTAMDSALLKMEKQVRKHKERHKTLKNKKGLAQKEKLAT
jgi:putative sigma-54 modulation protein